MVLYCSGNAELMPLIRRFSFPRKLLTIGISLIIFLGFLMYWVRFSCFPLLGGVPFMCAQGWYNNLMLTVDLISAGFFLLISFKIEKNRRFWGSITTCVAIGLILVGDIALFVGGIFVLAGGLVYVASAM